MAGVAASLNGRGGKPELRPWSSSPCLAALVAVCAACDQTSAVQPPDAGDCQTGRTSCGGQCVNTLANPSHCGRCGAECGSAEFCSQGRCESACVAGTSPCGQSCLSLGDDPLNCGICFRACAQGEKCNQGRCESACASGLADCSGSCVDLNADRNNCKVCGNACAIDETCKNASCVKTCTPTSCAAQGKNCGSISDGCGGVLSCGSCTAPNSCGGGGTPNVCGQATTCAMNITPASGPTTQTFVAQLATNGSECSWSFDGALQGPIDCKSPPIPFVPNCGLVGSHTVTLHVARGPSGPTQCNGSFTVTPGTSCCLSVSPTSGSPSTNFAASLDSNGSGCAFSYDGQAQGPTDCKVPSSPFTGSCAGVGSHTITIQVGGGPTGPTQCSASFTVASGTTCCLSITPASGSTTTTFTRSIQSNGSNCSWSLDGVNKGSRACTEGPTTFRPVDLGLGQGSHVFTYNVGTGPSGSAQCSATINVTP